MTLIGKILRGVKGIGLQLLNTAIPNLTSIKAMEAGGEGKLHLPSAATSWIYAVISLVSTVWVIYSLIQGKDPATIKEELELLNK